MTRREVISAACTAVVAALLVVLLLLVHLHFDRSVLPDPPRPTAGLLEEEEEYAELYTPPQSDTQSDPLPAYNPQPETNRSEAPVTPTRVQEPTPPPPTPPQPSREEIEIQEARETANNEMANAFAQPSAKPGNTSSPGSNDGPAGTPSGASSAVNGRGEGSVGGGWILPSYADVRCEQTGSVVLRAIIDREGKVVKVEQIGGQAPASANSKVVAACIAEVRSHTFTRKDNNAPQRAIATITYRWR